MTRWVFVLVFLAYLFGPSRAVDSESEALGNPVVAAIARPVEDVLRVVYPQVPVTDRARWTVRLLCALSTAGAVALTFVTLSRLTSPEGALLLAGVVAFASPLWSWTSRCDIPGAVATLVVALALFPGLGRGERASRLASPVDRMAAIVAAVLIVLGTSWLLRAGSFVLFDPGVFAAYLLSPGRGLAFFAPVFLLAAAALAAGKGRRPVVWGAALVVLALLYQLASWSEPWGPLGFGPTLLAPCVPVLAVMAAGLPGNWLRVGALLSLPAVLAHGAAVFRGGHTWDERREIVHNPEAVWDFHDSPFTDLAVGPPEPDPTGFAAIDYFMRPGDYITREGHAFPWLAYGWEKPEARGVWAAGRESWIVIAIPPGDYILTLIASGPRRRDQSQRLEVERPAQPPLELSFAKDLWELEPLAIPFRAEHNLTVLKLRPAHAWMPGHGDVRRCGIFLTALRLKDARVP